MSGDQTARITTSRLEQLVSNTGFGWSVLESVPGTAVVVFDPELRIVAAVGRAFREQGYSTDLMRGSELVNVLPADLYETFLPHYQQALSGQESRLENSEALGGSFSIEFAPLADTDGTVLGGIAVVRETTEVHRALNALAEHEREYRDLAMNSSDLIMRCDSEITIEFASPAAETLLGLRPDEMVGCYADEFMHPDDAASLARQRQALRSTGQDEVVRLDGRLRHRDGHWVWTEATVRPLVDADDQPTGIQIAFRDMTDRRAFEDQLRLSNDRDRTVLENIPDTIVIRADVVGTCRFICGGALKASGLDADDCLGQSLDQIFTRFGKTGLEVLVCNYSVLAGEPSATTRLTSDATDQHYDVTILPQTDAQGSVAGTMIVAREITQHLRDQHEVGQLARALAATGEAIMSSSLNGLITTVNPSACQLYGYAADELVGRDDAKLVSPGDASLRDEARREVLSGSVWRGEQEHITSDGRTFTASVTLSPVFNTGGVLVGRTMLVRDISEQRAARNALLAANQRFEKVIANSPIGMALVDIDGSWLDANRALCEIVGYERDALLRMTFQDITHPDDVDIDIAFVGEVLAGERATYEMEKRYIRSDGSLVWVLLSVSMVRDANDNPLHFISQILDISDRKRSEERLRAEAERDSLTGVLTRKPFTAAVNTRLGAARRQGDSSALLFLDLDGFKAVNDAYGHQVGDELLKSVAIAIRDRLREADVIARFGGDEFTVMLAQVDHPGAVLIAAELQQAIEAVVVDPGGVAAQVGASIGMVMLDPSRYDSAVDALAAADEAMYKAKASR